MTRLESIRAEHKRLGDEMRAISTMHDHIIQQHDALPWWAFWRGAKLTGEGYELLRRHRLLRRRCDELFREFLRLNGLPLCALEREGKVRVG